MASKKDNDNNNTPSSSIGTLTVGTVNNASFAAAGTTSSTAGDLSIAGDVSTFSGETTYNRQGKAKASGLGGRPKVGDGVDGSAGTMEGNGGGGMDQGKAKAGGLGGRPKGGDGVDGAAGMKEGNGGGGMDVKGDGGDCGDGGTSKKGGQKRPAVVDVAGDGGSSGGSRKTRKGNRRTKVKKASERLQNQLLWESKIPEGLLYKRLNFVLGEAMYVGEVNRVEKEGPEVIWKVIIGGSGNFFFLNNEDAFKVREGSLLGERQYARISLEEGFGGKGKVVDGGDQLAGQPAAEDKSKDKDETPGYYECRKCGDLGKEQGATCMFCGDGHTYHWPIMSEEDLARCEYCCTVGVLNQDCQHCNKGEFRDGYYPSDEEGM